MAPLLFLIGEAGGSKQSAVAIENENENEIEERDQMKVAESLVKKLYEKKEELESRVERLAAHVKPLDPDSKEAALELEGEEVRELLDLEARQELAQINIALKRVEDGSYGICTGCDQKIPVLRLEAMPFALECVECASA